MTPLAPPDDTFDNDNAVEVLRGWIVGEDLQVSLAFEAFGNNPEIWGQLLAETVTHLADAMSAKKYGKRDIILARIRSSLEEHLENPYPGLHGAVREPTQ
jgi:hypothetical protein